MQEEGVISTHQFVWMLFAVIVSANNFLAPEFLIGIAGRDAWLSALGGWLLDVLLAVVYGYMGLRFAGQNFVQYSRTILGKYLGGLVGLVFSLFFLLTCAGLMSCLAHTLNIVFIRRTPFAAILIAGFILIGYATRQGIEVTGRVASVLGPLKLLSIIALILLLIPRIDLSQLQPQFDQGVYPFLIGSPFILSFYGICVVMAMFIPLCNRPENGFIAKFIAVSMGAGVVGGTVVVGTAIFGYKRIRESINPGMLASTMVNIGGFWERLEVLWAIIAVAAGVLASAVLIWAFSLGCAQVLQLHSYRPLVYPASLLAVVIGLTSFGNYLTLANFVHYVYPLLAWFVEAGLELFLFALAFALNKRHEIV